MAMSNLSVTTGLQQVDATLRTLTDPALPVEDRAAAYSVLHRFQLLVNRALRPVKDELIAHMEGNGIRALGPLSVMSSAIDPVYVCNDPANFDDITTQDALEGLRADPDYSEYVRVIPAHLEIDAARLGADTHAGIPQARQLFEQLKEHGWRREAGRRLSLKVAEPTRRDEAA
jgi:hypothetical protein